MRNRRTTLSARLLLGAILFFVVGGVAVLALWALPRHQTETVQAAGKTEEHHEGDHTADARDEHEEAGHTDDEHGPEEGERGASQVVLTPGQIKLAEIRTEPARIGDIDIELSLPAEVRLNEDRLAHIVSRVPGVAETVHKTLGETVKEGDVMAVIESRELASDKAAYLAASERVALALANYTREEGLWKRKISSEKEYLDAKQALAEARIELRLAGQKLHALGFSHDYLQGLSSQSDEAFTRYEITAPFAGTIIEKHITPGELVGENDLYLICDLDTVWVIASVYEQDIARINKGQSAIIVVKAYQDRLFSGKVTWIADVIEEETRTLKVRIEVDNRERLLKPGMFARITLGVGTKRSAVTIPASAVQTQKGETIVFVDQGSGQFERREIETGIHSATDVEVLEGVQEGEKVVTSGSFILKSELEKEGFEAGHAH